VMLCVTHTYSRYFTVPVLYTLSVRTSGTEQTIFICTVVTMPNQKKATKRNTNKIKPSSSSTVESLKKEMSSSGQNDEKTPPDVRPKNESSSASPAETYGVEMCLLKNVVADNSKTRLFIYFCFLCLVAFVTDHFPLPQIHIAVYILFVILHYIYEFFWHC
jgi:hypothetical protein